MLYFRPEFLFLFLPALFLYFALPRRNQRTWLLLITSFIFYSWAGFVDTLIFLSVILASWSAVYFSSKAKPERRKFWIGGGVTVMVLHLFFWKYAVWLTGEIQSVFPDFLGGMHLKLPLPVGISFFTLQGIAYLIDFSRGDAPFMNLKEYAAFKSFFPQLVAGPIVRASELLPQLRILTTPVESDLSIGLSLFTLGFFKKLAIADRLSPFVDEVFSNPQNYGRYHCLIGLIAYSFQIWADFSGYTDMGRGAARMLGIVLPENFLSPYLSSSPSEFWRRWHITLSRWINDYLYVPLSFSMGRRVSWGVYLALVVTMMISGMWHGANWTFLLWGLYHGFLLAAEAVLKKTRLAVLFQKISPGGSRFLSMLYMWPLLLFGWLIFRAPSISLVVLYLKALWTNSGTASVPFSIRSVYFTILIGLGIQVIFFQELKSSQSESPSLWRKWAASLGRLPAPRFRGSVAGAFLAFTFFLALFIGASNPEHAFIYFQF